MQPISGHTPHMTEAYKRIAAAAGNVLAAARSVWSACELSESIATLSGRELLLAYYDELTHVLDDESGSGLLAVAGMTLADGRQLEKSVVTSDRFLEVEGAGRARRFIVGACESIFLARKNLWDCLAILEDEPAHAMYRAAFGSYEALGSVLQRDADGGGILDFAGMRIVLGWPSDAVVVKNLITTSIYLHDIGGEPFYGSPVMLAEAHSIWHSNVDNAQAHAADRLREEAAS